MQGELTCSTGVPQPNQAWRECWAGMATPTPSGYAVTPPTLIGPKVTGHLTLGEKCGSHTHYAQHLITVQDKPALEQQPQKTVWTIPDHRRCCHPEDPPIPVPPTYNYWVGDKGREELARRIPQQLSPTTENADLAARATLHSSRCACAVVRWSLY